MPSGRRPYDSFTAYLKAYCDEASDVAVGLQHEYVGTEHLLAVVCEDAEDAVKEVIEARGLTAERIVDYLDTRSLKSNREVGSPLPLSPRLKSVLDSVTGGARQPSLEVGKVRLLLALLEHGSGGFITAALRVDVHELADALAKIGR